jgi:putative PIN family toxin of toxin-antitoxin system
MTNRYVLDTNTIISALLIPSSVPRQAVDKAFETGHVLVSDVSIAELTDVIKRPRFNRYIREEERLQFLALFINTTTPVPISETITDCRDPKTTSSSK